MKDQRGNIVPVIAVIFGLAVVVTIFAYQFWPKDKDFALGPLILKKHTTNSNANVNANTNAANTNVSTNINAATNANGNTNSSANATQGWKTYSNSALYYTYKYPADLKASECTDAGVAIYSFVSASTVVCGTEWLGAGFSIAKQPSTYNQATTITQTQAAITNPTTTTTTIDGMTATRVRGVTKTGSDVLGGGGKYSDYLFFTRNGTGYIVSNLSTTGTAFRESDFATFLMTIDFTQ